MVSRLLKGLLLLFCIFSLNAVQAQNPIGAPGAYTYLGSCVVSGQNHYYYLSTAAVQWPAANAAATGLGGYLATLTSLDENNCVYGKVITAIGGYTPYINGAIQGDYDNDNHPWIGLSDAGNESNFTWANGENCSDFRNWDAGEPNNFGPPPGEDYVQLLTFGPPEGIAGSRGGKWNDWYNDRTQRYIVEFGPNPCAPAACTPSTTVTDGDLTGGLSSFSVTSTAGSVTVDHVNAGTGLRSLTVVGTPTNAVVTIPAFTPGTFDPVTVTFTAINPALPVVFRLRAASQYHSIFIDVTRCTPPPPPCVLTVSAALPALSCQGANTLYLGYGPQSITATSPASNVTFTWYKVGNPNTVVGTGATYSPTEPGTYYVVASKTGCTSASTQGMPITVIDIRCANPGNDPAHKVYVCHKKNGSNGNGTIGDNAHTNCVDVSAVPDHLKHGDCLGQCPDEDKNKNKGSISARSTPLSEAVAGLNLRALSNPASGSFNIQVGSANAERITFKVMDMQGKLIEQRQNVQANQNIMFGNAYKPGVYFIEVMQGAERKQLKLVKSN